MAACRPAAANAHQSSARTTSVGEHRLLEVASKFIGAVHRDDKDDADLYYSRADHRLNGH